MIEIVRSCSENEYYQWKVEVFIDFKNNKFRMKTYTASTDNVWKGKHSIITTTGRLMPFQYSCSVDWDGVHLVLGKVSTTIKGSCFKEYLYPIMDEVVTEIAAAVRDSKTELVLI